MDVIIFVGLMLVVVLAYIAWRLRGKSWIEYFKTKDGLGILRGIIIAPLAVLVIGVIMALLPSKAEAGTWMNDASVFAGLDYTKKLSPMCESNDVDERGTSNLGVKFNLWQSESKNVRVNPKYTHHSCALGADNKQYDAVGVELEWKVWSR